MSTTRFPARDLAHVAVFAALIIALGLPGSINIGISGVPITLQSMGVMMAGALLGPRKGVLAVLTVIALGLVGLPVLAGGRTALVSLSSPTAGFLIGWIPTAFVIGWLTAKMLPKYRIIAGIGINLLGGVVVLISNLAQLWSVIPLNGTLAGAAAAPVFAFEVWFALHLIVVGLPHRQADTPQ